VAECEDLNERGLFVSTRESPPAGAVVGVTLELPDGTRVRATARVAHVLTTGAAGALGRRPGCGLEFLEFLAPADGRARLHAHVEARMARPASIPPAAVAVRSVVVVDPDVAELERARAALADDGFEVRTAYTGAEAYTMCLEEPPDVVLAAARMPAMDGWELVRTLMGRSALHLMPVVLIVDDVADLRRLRSQRVGVTDFIHRPFDPEELCARVRRIAASDRPTSGRIVFAGDLTEIGVRTLLSLLELEHKSGVLDLFRGDEVARLYLAGGRVVKIDGGGEGEPLDRVMNVLDWGGGSFEFAACTIVGADELGLRTSQLLLEHARLIDEHR
jgi:CheY-like chemotaxis protein